MHHAMTDGVGGLAVLAALGDDGVGPATDGFPEACPPLRSIAADAWRARAVAGAAIPGRLRASRLGLGELGLGTEVPSLASRTVLNRPTGSQRRLTTIEVPLIRLSHVAHSLGCTVNDILLTAVTGAMADVLERGGDRPPHLVVSVPISVRRTTTADVLGNQTGVVPMRIPTLRDQRARLACIAAMSRAWRARARGESAAPIGLVFRSLAKLGLFQKFIDHQRLVHTFVTNVRGPRACVQLAGHPISSVIPMAVTPGNVGVAFDVLSYAGRFVVTVVADPDILTDQDVLTSLLAEELTQLLTEGPAPADEGDSASRRSGALWAPAAPEVVEGADEVDGDDGGPSGLAAVHL
jgi:diacylglycerol O-acyltransferase